ncbi:MAG: hypothetical protein QM541_05780 [Flavobacterium sp.]|nr:hypothetical protein [Flavobacterium sp.]
MASVETIKTIQNPSLLRQIVDEVDSMNEEAQAALLRKIKMQQAVAEFKALEACFTPSQMTEEEIWEMCSATRRELYEEKMKKDHELSD